MNVVKKVLTPIFTVHLMDADRSEVAHALRVAKLDMAYNRWIVNSSPMDSTKEFSKSEGSFPICSMEELSSLLVALAGVVCDKWLQCAAQDMDTICSILLMRDGGSAEWIDDTLEKMVREMKEAPHPNLQARRVLSQMEGGSAEWTCARASISRQFDEALTQIERVIASARTSTPLARKEESKG